MGGVEGGTVVSAKTKPISNMVIYAIRICIAFYGDRLWMG